MSGIDSLLGALTLEDKASLTSGSDAWHLQGIEGRGVAGYMITDGPHGLRKTTSETGDIDLDHTVPATCFPPAAGLSSSWNPELIREVGEAMAEECIQEKVAVILGPGVNIKRNPLGGRCFEFWSEDPYLAGHEAIGIVQGVQSKGVGTSLKHFAVNNQETDRLRISANLSPRALREIYLPAFEYIVKTAQPWTIMCSYNQINAVHSAQNRWLLTDVLRGEWGFRGIVMSDWGADHDRVASVNAGLNLEMPPSFTDDLVVEAVRDGRIEPAQLDRMARGMLDLVEKTTPAMNVDGYRFDVDRHDDVARRAACESMVLLKNDDGILPLSADSARGTGRAGEKAAGGAEPGIAVIGEFARTPRYQGGGSSHITPTRMTSFLDALSARSVPFDFAPGFTLDDDPQNPALTAQAVECASKAASVILFMGLPEQAESEGFDRTDMDLPLKQRDLLDALAQANENIVVVLSNGSVVSMHDWRERPKAILESWLLGQAGGSALADVIFGSCSPSGKLAQSIPARIEDDPSMMNWPGEERHVDYGEGVFVGYRYYDTYGVDVDYPFGFGLSYAAFAIGDVRVRRTGGNRVAVSATVTNTSSVRGAETVQIYVAPHPSAVARPRHELKAFRKVWLDAGASDTVDFELDERSFAYWSELYDGWRVEPGDYAIEVATSSRDVDKTMTVRLPGDGRCMPLDEWSTVAEWRDDPVGARIVRRVEEKSSRGELPSLPSGDTAAEVFLGSLPVNTLSVLLGRDGAEVTRYMLDEYARAAGGDGAHDTKENQ